MSENKPNAPKLRFPGFTDPWEQRKLKQVSEKVTEKNVGFEYSETLTNSAEFGIMSQHDFFDKSISNEASIDEYYIVRNDDFVYNPRISTYAPVGPIKRNKLGRTGVMSPLYYVFRTHDINQSYLEYFFATTIWHRFMKLNGDTGARSDRFSIKGSVFREMPIPWPPSACEQSCIGTFFQQLDSLITLHQRKLDHVKDLKKGLLQKMFPKEGESVPELRFPGFTDPWEQRKLGDIADRITRKNKNLDSELPLTISAQYGLVNQEEFFKKRVASKDLRGYYLVKRGEFAYNKSTSSESPWGVVKRLERHESGCVSTLYIVFATKEINPQFLATYYETDRWFKGVRAIATEGARNHGLLNISPADFFKTGLYVPCSEHEQEAIGAFFQQLDSLITLHQREEVDWLGQT